ncbi:hypothetical protein EDC04DRAFT_1700457 [Pisolithus marmoratus]|nr:hypothetical protein EDC04DRAFT_1700457 [Pisolithus marmoratus]
MDIVRQFILQLQLHTFFPTIRATDNFEVALMRLTERWDWSIAAYRSYLSLPSENTRTIVCTLVFLAVAQGMRLLYGQLTAEQLRVLVDTVGPHTFSAVAAIPSIGVVIVSAMQISDIAGSPLIAVSLMLAIMVLIVILPVAMFSLRRLPTEHTKYISI